MIGNGKFEPLTVWNENELRYRITASHSTGYWQFYDLKWSSQVGNFARYFIPKKLNGMQ